MLCYLMASHCNPMLRNLRIPSFIEAVFRVRWWIMHYAPMQFWHVKEVAQPGGLRGFSPPSQAT